MDLLLVQPPVEDPGELVGAEAAVLRSLSHKGAGMLFAVALVAQRAIDKVDMTSQLAGLAFLARI